MEMKIITWNINGYRSADKLGAIKDLICKDNPDIICLQEIKMNEKVINDYGYNCYYNFANKKGYSGALIFSKREPINVIYKLGLDKFDQEGRFILLEYIDFVLINIYIPHGGRKKENHPYKFASINKLLDIIKKSNKKIIICTDFNIAHTELDVKNYKTNYNNNMFSYEERAMIDKLLDLGLIDSFRSLIKEDNIYSMWPNGFNARERNMGWRIDYIFTSKQLEKNIENVRYLQEQFGSDHCPCKLEINI
jgi:exodeoxyribonuclease-3